MSSSPSSSDLPPAATLLGRRIVSLDAEAGTAVLTYDARPEFANRHGTVQGGLLAAMLDSATGATLTACLPPDLTAVTTRLTTTFVKAAPVGPLTATVRIVANDGRGAEVEAAMAGPDGAVVARGVAQLRILKRR
jgi:uncharacterized protein (TIGR00369 family)